MLVWFRLMLRLNGLVPNSATVFISAWFSVVMSRESQDEREQAKFVLLMNGDDPILKFGAQVAWRKPDWLGPDDKRPLGSPHGSLWLPGMTCLTTCFDMQNALVPAPGIFAEGGHDYRDVLQQAISETWRLSATDERWPA